MEGLHIANRISFSSSGEQMGMPPDGMAASAAYLQRFEVYPLMARLQNSPANPTGFDDSLSPLATDVIDRVKLGDDTFLPVEIHQPGGTEGLVILASDHAHYDPPCREVARALNAMGFQTLLLGLRTAEEEKRSARLNWLHHQLDFLARRLRAVVGWVRDELGYDRQPLGCFATKAVAAAALLAAAQEPTLLQAVVCSEGQPDFAGLALAAVTSPTLLIVPERDPLLLERNRDACDHLTCAKHLEIVFGVSRLTDVPAAVTRIEQSAAAWFGWYLQAEASARKP